MRRADGYNFNDYTVNDCIYLLGFHSTAAAAAE